MPHFSNQVHLLSRIDLKAKSPNVRAMPMDTIDHRLNVVNTSQSARMPRFLACPAIYGSKIGPKTSQE